MHEIKILFFVLGSFFAVEDSRIFAEKTTVTIYPKEQRIQILQETLFTFIKTEEDEELSLSQWSNLKNEDGLAEHWAEELDECTSKQLEIKETSAGGRTTIQSVITVTYSEEKELEAMGIWYDTEKNQFSLNHNPDNNIKTSSGKLDGNYWYFDVDSVVTFSVEPFLNLPDDYMESLVTLEKLLRR
ncbi:MAG: hypothetical protein AB8F78_09255 [Saprospiraceae bacterium]